MNRMDRLLSSVTVLQSRKYTSLEYLADLYDVSERTVYRDLKSLGEIGIPIGFEPNRGYFLVDGYFMAPSSFSKEEANALLLVEPLAHKFTDDASGKFFQSAMVKIKATLKPPLKAQISELQERIKIYTPPQETESNRYLMDIQQAITFHKQLKIKYTNNQGIQSERIIEPIGLTYYGQDWHVIGWCWNRNAYRDFKTTHIADLSVLKSDFEKKDHSDLNEYIQQLN